MMSREYFCYLEHFYDQSLSLLLFGISFISIVIILLIIFWEILRILSLEFHGAAGRYGRNIMEGGGRGLGDVQ